jgi:ATP-dependent Clp protease ATP-binding subunit ClpA
VSNAQVPPCGSGEGTVLRSKPVFERFTDFARRSVVLAQEEARRLDHDFIGTEHLLLGLLRQSDGVAARALGRLGLEASEARLQVEELVGHGVGAPSAHIPFTPRAKKVLELSLREALQLKHDYIGTEHMLLGIVREGEGVAAQVLTHSGLDLSTVRATLLEMLDRADIVHESHEAVTTEPARCSFCDSASPECGTLFVRSAGWTTSRLICERCLAAGRGGVPR